MLKCLNLRSITGNPCPNLIHVACSEFSVELAAILKVYYCADCTNLRSDLHDHLEAAQMEATEMLKELEDEGKISLNEYKSLEAVAKLLSDQLTEKVDLIEGQQSRIESLETKVNELSRMFANQSCSNLRTEGDKEKQREANSNDSFESAKDSEQERNRRSSTVIEQLNEALRTASRIKPRVAFAGSDLDKSLASNSSRVTIGFPNYEEQEVKAKALSDQSLLLIRVSIAIQPFKGDFTRWSMFLSDFIRTSAKGHYKAYEDMERLRDLIQGEANEMFLTELSDPCAEPIAVLKRLDGFYGVRGSAVRVALDGLTQLSKADKPNDKQRLKTLYTRAKNFALQCDIHNQNSELTSEAVLYILESKMCNEHRYTWKEWAKLNQRSEGVDGVIAFLEDKIRELNLHQTRHMPQFNTTTSVNLAEVTGGQSSSNASVTSDDDSTASSKSSSSRRKKRGDVTCYYCLAKHPLYKCPKFCSLSKELRSEEVARLCICTRCLCSDRHQPEDCSLKLLSCKVEGCLVEEMHPLLHGHSDDQIPTFIFT